MALQSSKYRMPQNGPAQDDATPPTVAPLQLHGISGYKQPQTLAMRVQAYGGPESLLCMLHVALRSASSLCAPQFCAAMAASSSFRTLSEVELRDKLSVIILSPPPLHHNRPDPCPIRLGVELGAGADLSESSTRCFQGVKAWRGFQ
ncbi:hypothetical protein VCV18_009723 [Metarhizium anisopliae]